MQLGFKIGRTLQPNDTVCLYGQLGAGKTQLAKGLIHGATGVDTSEVGSPTFVYLNIYQGAKKVFHFDLYRLCNVEDFLSMGFDDYFEESGICCIEWPERIASILPENSVKIYVESTGERVRRFIFDWNQKW